MVAERPDGGLPFDSALAEALRRINATPRGTDQDEAIAWYQVLLLLVPDA